MCGHILGYLYVHTHIYIYDEQATVRAMQRPIYFPSTCKRTPSADCTWPKGPLIHTASATHMFIVGPHCDTSAATSKLTRPPCEGPFQLCFSLSLPITSVLVGSGEAQFGRLLILWTFPVDGFHVERQIHGGCDLLWSGTCFTSAICCLDP